MDASMHAAQNERLPLRTVVRVLYFEQIRTAAGVQGLNNSSSDDALDSGRVTQEEWEKPLPVTHQSARKQMSQMSIADKDPQKNAKLEKKASKNRGSGAQLLPSRSRRIFDKLWGVGKGTGNGENRSSETSGSSQSPTSMAQGETKSSGSSSRRRRHSIS